MAKKKARRDVPGTVYLVHLENRLNSAFPARHYLGWADDLEARLAAHWKGQGSRFLAVARERGVSWRLARTWEGATRYDERDLKNGKRSPRLCPFCNPAVRRKMGWRLLVKLAKLDKRVKGV